MFRHHKATGIEQTILFTLLLSIVGGYMNAYSYFIRGGSLVSMQSGNMARIGIAFYLRDVEFFIISGVPIIGCLAGVTLSHIMRHKFSDKSRHYWQKLSLYIELILFALVGAIPADFHNHTVNFTIAIAAGFQFYNIKIYRGYTHGTTIASGNLKNLGQILGDAIINRDKASFILLVEYFILFMSFSVGAVLGSFLSVQMGETSIWVCCFILFILISLVRLEEANKRINTRFLNTVEQ